VTTIIIASHNEKKRAELHAALAPHLPYVEVRTLADVGVDAPVEDADSFTGNALLKARHCVAHTGYAALADDSGLCVELLDGAPGVYSARYAGEGATDALNNEKLVADLAALGEPGPFRAAFHAAVVFATPDGVEQVETGIMPGVVRLEAAGTAGFGYDPYFYADAYDNMRSNAELAADEKLAVSHRGQALDALLPAIVSWASQNG
jgi:XTP/dITP diphosphohydrolase